MGEGGGGFESQPGKYVSCLYRFFLFFVVLILGQSVEEEKEKNK